jgi:hypothetical protein
MAPPPWYRHGTALESGTRKDPAGTLTVPAAVVTLESHVAALQAILEPKAIVPVVRELNITVRFEGPFFPSLFLVFSLSSIVAELKTLRIFLPIQQILPKL